MFRKSLDTFTELGGNWFVARVLANMSWSILALGNDAEAEHIWREALRIATEIQGIPVALDALAGFASLQAKQGDREHALELVLIVLNHPTSLQETKNRASGLRADLEAQSTPTQIEAIQMHVGEKPSRRLWKTFSSSQECDSIDLKYPRINFGLAWSGLMK